MALTSIIVGVMAILAASYFLFGSSSIKRNGESLRRPPNTLPLLGNGILFLQARHKLFSWFVKCEQKFGFETFEISVPSLPPGVVLNDPKNLEFVLKNECLFSKGDLFKSRSWDLFGHGIINADGEKWKVQRKAGLHFLSNANLKILMDTALPRYLKDSVSILESTGSEETIDLEVVFHELTTQLMGRMAYDMEMHATDDFSTAFDFASGATGERFQNPLWQVTEIFFGSQLRQSVAVVKKVGDMIVGNAVLNREKNSQSKRAQGEAADKLDTITGSLINSLLDSIEDKQTVADAALNYLSAGRDTTAQALTWAFYLLMSHPEATSKVLQEASRYTSKISEPMRLQEYPYALAVFYEALRLYPPVPFELKQAEASTTLPDGTFLPSSSVVLWCTWAMNRSKLIWGPDSEVFRPDRWIEDGIIVAKTAFEFPVFNGGPRTCLGKKMAELMAVKVILTLIGRFEFSRIDDKVRVSKNSLTLPMEGGLPCRVKKRQLQYS